MISSRLPGTRSLHDAGKREGPARARIVSRTPLFYARGADAALDRPAHVRAGSGVVVVDTKRGKRLLVVQDDTSILAFVDPKTKAVESLELPAGPSGKRTFDDEQGNKKHKLDLECVTQLGDSCVAFGSGSSDQRNRVVLIRPDRDPPEAKVIDAHAFYDVMRAHPLLRDAELNIEGAAVTGDTVTFFQRGNGKGGVDATFAFDAKAFRAFLDDPTRPAPPVTAAKRWDLGAVDVDGKSVRLTFTDACAFDGDTWVVAAAEDSPNAVDDGVVVGCALGKLGTPLGPILDESGARFVGKPEGLAIESRDRAWIVVDKDDHHAPCELLEIRLL
jgi:hypothetical protein